MKIVIDISDTKYKWIVNNPQTYTDELHEAIRNGTPLPKGHGRLIDADVLQAEMEKDVRRAMSFVDLLDFVWLAPTIIEGVKADGTET